MVLKSTALKAATKLMQVTWRWSRGLTVGVQGCLVDGDGRIMLVRHGYRPGWHFPGGGVEKGEAASDALRRELLEEVGVTLSENPDLFAVYANFRYFPGDHILLYVSRNWTQDYIPAPNFEIAEVKRFLPAELPADIHPPTRARIGEVLDNDPPAHDWHV